MGKMKRREILLDDASRAALEAAATAQDRSAGWLVRRLIATYLAPDPHWSPTRLTPEHQPQTPTPPQSAPINDARAASPALSEKEKGRSIDHTDARAREDMDMGMGIGPRPAPPAPPSARGGDLVGPAGAGPGDCVGSPSGSPGDCVSRAEGGAGGAGISLPLEARRWAQVAVERINELTGETTYKADQAVVGLINEIRRAGYDLPAILAVVEDRYRKIGKDPERKRWLAPTTLFKARLFSKYHGLVGVHEPALGPLKPKTKGAARSQSWGKRQSGGYYRDK